MVVDESVKEKEKEMANNRKRRVLLLFPSIVVMVRREREREARASKAAAQPWLPQGLFKMFLHTSLSKLTLLISKDLARWSFQNGPIL